MGAWRARTALAAGIVLSWCVDVRAQDAGSDAGAAPPPAPPEAGGQKVTITTKGPETAQWPERFAEAKQALLDGEWDNAASAFDTLASSAPSAEDARAAKELGEVARYWKKRDLVFVQRQALGESDYSSKAVGRRTLDELVSLYIWGSIYGAGLGLSMAAMLEGSSAIAYVIPAIVGAGAGIGGVALADTFGRIHYGQAQAVVSGTFLGLGEALIFDFWHLAHDGSNYPSTSRWNDAKPYVGIGIATTTLGGALGGLLGGVLPMTPGRASWVSSMGLWSGGIVACIAGAIGASTLKEDVAVFGLAGYNAGIVGGIFTAGPVSPSISRVRLLDLGGVVGGATFFGIYAAIASTGQNGLDANASLGVAGLGIAAGLTTSWLLTRNMAPDYPNEPGEAKKAPSADVHPILYPLPGGASAGFAGSF